MHFGVSLYQLILILLFSGSYFHRQTNKNPKQYTKYVSNKITLDRVQTVISFSHVFFLLIVSAPRPVKPSPAWTTPASGTTRRRRATSGSLCPRQPGMGRGLAGTTGGCWRGQATRARRGSRWLQDGLQGCPSPSSGLQAATMTLGEGRIDPSL
jgi:hypothetical protein